MNYSRRDFMKLSAAASAPLMAEPRKPLNLVLIMADDLGTAELGCYGHPAHETPHLDALARSGTMFRTCWATPVCSPTRVEIMTGRYGFRTGWTNFIGRVTTRKTHLDPDELTFADVVKTRGYVTALAGKWQLGVISKRPDMVRENGFDEHLTWSWIELPPGSDYGGKGLSRYWHPAAIRNGEYFPTTPDQYGPDLYSGWLIDFIKRNKDRPFLAYYPMCLTHSPYDPTPDASRPGGKTEGGLRNNVQYMDTVVGRIVAALEELGLREDTVVMFTGDNGTQGAGKNTATEMGVRVPFIANCPGIVKAGMVRDELIDLSDVLPTLAEFAGAALPAGVTIDGRSFAPLLRGEPGNPREWIFSYLAYERLLRDQRWLLEGDGKFYDCGESRAGKGYRDVTNSTDPEVLAARKRFESILEKLPAPPLESGAEHSP